MTGVPADQGVGVEGPNNGYPLENTGSPGELDGDLNTPNDSDFSNEVTTGFDASVLQFKITLTAPGFLSIRFVHATDEHPQFSLSEFNDTPLVFIGDENGQDLENIITFINASGVETTLTLDDLKNCGLLVENLVAPAPASLQTSPHANVNTTLHFDHEFGGFTKPLVRENKCILAPGTYTIKIVVQDVDDDAIDSATFFEENGLKLFSFLLGDLDLEGDVDVIDFGIFADHFGQTGNVGYLDGDLDNDGDVDTIDHGIFADHFGETGGNANFCADFDRDNDVDGADHLIWQRNFGLNQCASRANGDADADGDVDGDDRDIWQTEAISSRPSGLCGCVPAQHVQGGGGAALAALPAGAAQAAAIPTPSPNHPLDLDGDNDLDANDIELFLLQKAAAE